MKSMTGYAICQKDYDWGKVVIELRSVNHRYGDVTTKLPRSFFPYEEKLKKEILNVVKRGRITLHIHCDRLKDVSIDIMANVELAKTYQASIQELQKALGLSGDVPLHKYPCFQDFFQKEGIDEAIKVLPYEELSVLLQETLVAFIKMREEEGGHLKDDLLKRLAHLENLILAVSKRSELSKEIYREHLASEMKKVLEDKSIDEARLLTEVAIYSERIDIAEELTRFASHLEKMKETFALVEPMGRRADFILQELHREVTTLSNKCADIGISKLSVDIKCELEKIREQVQNIE